MRLRAGLPLAGRGESPSSHELSASAAVRPGSCWLRSSKPGLRSQPDQAWASQFDFKLSEAARRPGDRDSDPEQARVSHVRPRAGLGESSAAQSRPGRVDFKLSVAHSPAGPTDSESGRALACQWATSEST